MSGIPPATGIHDMGGTTGWGRAPVPERDEPVFKQPWEARAFAMAPQSTRISGTCPAAGSKSRRRPSRTGRTTSRPLPVDPRSGRPAAVLGRPAGTGEAVRSTRTHPAAPVWPRPERIPSTSPDCWLTVRPPWPNSASSARRVNTSWSSRTAPTGTTWLAEEDLVPLVTRDAMVGVAKMTAPCRVRHPWSLTWTAWPLPRAAPVSSSSPGRTTRWPWRWRCGGADRLAAARH